MPRLSPLTLNQSLMPRDACPSAMASRLAADRSSKRTCGSTLSGTVSTHVRARRTSPLRVRTSTPSLTGPSESTGVESHCANGRLRSHRVDQAARSGPNV